MDANGNCKILSTALALAALNILHKCIHTAMTMDLTMYFCDIPLTAAYGLKEKGCVKYYLKRDNNKQF
jgi:hypothetical protein